MEEYSVVGSIDFLNLRFGMIINVVSKNLNSYCHNWWHLVLHHNVIEGFRKANISVYYKHSYIMFGFLCKLDYDNDKFICVPTYTYNVVMWLLELTGVVDHE